MRIKKGGVLLRWAIVLLLLGFIYFWQRELIGSALREAGRLSAPKLLLCTALTAGYFLADAQNLHILSMRKARAISFCDAFSLTLSVAFVRCLTLGSGAGPAEIYYLSRRGIDAGTAAGITLVRYAFQKLAVGTLGCIAFLALWLRGTESVTGYAVAILIAALINALIVTALLLAALSDRLYGFLMRKLKKEAWKEKLGTFHESGREIFHDRQAFLDSFLTGALKFFSWYLIPCVILYGDMKDSVWIGALLMAIANMAGGVMLMPGGVGTLETVFYLLFRTQASDELLAMTLILYRFFTWLLPCAVGGIATGYLNGKDRICLKHQNE